MDHQSKKLKEVEIHLFFFYNICVKRKEQITMESKDIKKEESLKKYKEPKDLSKLSDKELRSELLSILGEDMKQLKIKRHKYKDYSLLFLATNHPFNSGKQYDLFINQFTSKLIDKGYACYNVGDAIRVEKETDEMQELFESSKVARDMRAYFRHTSDDASPFFNEEYANRQLENLAEYGYIETSYIRVVKKLQKALEKRGYDSSVSQNSEFDRMYKIKVNTYTQLKLF